MTRDIKFRGKRLDNGEWVYGDLVKLPNKNVYIYASSSFYKEYPLLCINLEMYALQVDPATVGQYTGRTAQCTDKIFGDDICVVTRFDCNGADYQYKCVVEWCDGGFAFCNEEKEIFIPLGDIEDADSDVEVIGNQWEDGVLLNDR